MPSYTFTAIGIDAMTISGPVPFSSGASRNADAIDQNTQISIASSDAWTDIVVADDDPDLEDADSGQELAQPVTFNGTSWGVGESVEIEYSYVIRPVGSTDPADQITIYVLEFGTDAQGIATDARLAPGVTYEIIPGGSDDPVQSYSSLTVCFTTGTPILTVRGWRPIEAVRAGDMVQTLDDGPQRVVWTGRQVIAGLGPRAPIRIAKDVLGNRLPLCLSPQHRVLLPPGALGLDGEHLLAIKGLVGLVQGIDAAPRLRVCYHHLLFDRHQVIDAAGARVESMLPGRMALKALAKTERARLFLRFPELEKQAGWSPARALLRPGEARRRVQQLSRRPGKSGALARVVPMV